MKVSSITPAALPAATTWTDGGIRQRARDVGRGQRAGQQRAGIDGGQGRAREDVEMLAEERKGVQWTCRGSVHPDAPVTRSNWRRSRLTT